MERSESLAKFFPAFFAAQKDVPQITKERRNEHLNSNYANLTDVMEACREPLRKNNIAIMQFPESSADGACAGVRTVLMHESGEFVSTLLLLKPRKEGPQEAGSAITYAKRYTLASMVGVIAEDDDDGNAASREKAAAQRRVEAGRVNNASHAKGTMSVAAIRTAIAKWSGMKDDDLAAAMTTAGRRAGCVDGMNTADKLAKMTAFIEANKGKDFLEVTQ